MLDLKDRKVGLSLILLSNLDHIYGPWVPYRMFPLNTNNSGSEWKSIFLKWYLDDLTLKMSKTLLGAKPYFGIFNFTRINLRVARSCKCLFFRLGRLARLRRQEYSTECVLYTILRALFCTLSTFLASEALQKCHIRWQYVKYGNIEDLYKSNFAFVGIGFLNLERTPTLWLAFICFIHSSLMCLLNTRCSSMSTPRRL